LDSRDVVRVALTIVEFLILGRRRVAVGAVEATLVPPVDPLGGRQLDLLEGTPRTAPIDELGLIEPDHGLGESAVITVTARTDGPDGAGLGQALGVADSHGLGIAVGVMDET
jgi:hypothetical protein